MSHAIMISFYWTRPNSQTYSIKKLLLEQSLNNLIDKKDIRLFALTLCKYPEDTEESLSQYRS